MSQQLSEQPAITGSGRRRGRIGIALYGDLTFDSRVRREAASIASAGFDVTLVCLADRSDRSDLPPNVRVIVQPLPDERVRPGALNPFRDVRLGRLASLARGAGWLTRYIQNIRRWGRRAARAGGPVDAWHVHDFSGLAAIAPAVGRDLPLVYDVHDLMLETGTASQLPGPARSLFRAYERRLAGRATAIVTVNGGLASVLRERYRRPVEAIHNCPDLVEIPTGRPTVLRDAIGLSEGIPLVLYHGRVVSERGIEPVMEAMLRPGLESLHLAVLGYGDLVPILARDATDPRWGGRLHVLDAVPSAMLLSWVAGADLGIVLHSRSRLNGYLATPNRLFQCLAAGVPILGSDFPAMREIVLGTDGPLGILCDPADADSVTGALRTFLSMSPDDRTAMATRCREAAQTRWNWAQESARLVRLYDRLLDRPAGA